LIFSLKPDLPTGYRTLQWGVTPPTVALGTRWEIPEDELAILQDISLLLGPTQHWKPAVDK